MRANLGPDRKTTATGTMRAVGSGCTEHTFDAHKKRANTAMEDTLSDQRLSTKEMGNKRIKHPQETRDKAAIAKAAAGAAGEDNDRDAEEALDHGAFGALVTERPTVAGGKGYVSLVDLSDIKDRLNKPPLEKPAVLAVLGPLGEVPEDCMRHSQHVIMPKGGITNSTFMPGAIYQLCPKVSITPGLGLDNLVQVQVTQLKHVCEPAFQVFEEQFKLDPAATERNQRKCKLVWWARPEKEVKRGRAGRPAESSSAK